MADDSPLSPFIRRAIEIAEDAKGTKLNPEERKKKAIELAGYLLREANRTRNFREKKQQAELSRMMDDPLGKVFTTLMTDQCFRSKNSQRVVDQLLYLLEKYGIPRYLSFSKRIKLFLFKQLGKPFAFLLGPLTVHTMRKETSSVILPGERNLLSKHMHMRHLQGVRLNLNHLGEAILGEGEAERRTNIYLDDLRNKDIEYVSIKLSTLYSQINLLAWDKTVEEVSKRLRSLYRAAMENTFAKKDGTKGPKFVNLDMEEYRDLILTKEVFKKVLSEPEFQNCYAGIVLQGYLPDSFAIQQELTEWAMERVANGGAPIKIRLVKGANLAMERVESNTHHWPQAPYKEKRDVDANYKRMMIYASEPEHAKAAHIGIGSHNLFDISYALLLRLENDVEETITFEMLEGMAEHMRRTVQKLGKHMLLYCPVAMKEDFQSAIAYLIRRLDENTGPENFLRYSFSVKPGSKIWNEQADFFAASCDRMREIETGPRRVQNRNLPQPGRELNELFDNESDTDFALPHNWDWAHNISDKWQKISIDPIPLVINGEEIHQDPPEGKGFDPSNPMEHIYHFSLATWEQVDRALDVAKKTEGSWSALSPKERAEHLSRAAHAIRENRADLMGAKLLDGGKTIFEGDPELSEAIDFAEYYARSILELTNHQDLTWKAKGTVLVTPPWNFPVAIPCGGILASLAAGNCVIFKPAPEAVLSGWMLVNALWKAGIPKNVLQFINCVDDPVGSQLIQDERINAVILTGATTTAQLFLQLRPNLDLSAETGGKNALIITAMADRDLAIKDLIHSAFGHSGQKCSAASLVILEAEVYDDPNFRKALKDAAESLTVGSAWDLSSKVVPLVHPPSEELKRGFTILEEGEEWLLEPKQDTNNPHLWSPGIKIGVKEGNYTHTTELFGPVLSVMRAKNLDHAIRLANGTMYGLTSGIHTLDIREQKIWEERIEAGNLYINRGITGAVVRRQPFGGCKASSFGHGSKAGGQNYIAQFMVPAQTGIPKEKGAVNDRVNRLSCFFDRIDQNAEMIGLWHISIANYAYWWEKFREKEDPSKVVGQDNYFYYKPLNNLCFRIQSSDSFIDVIRVMGAALTCQTNLEISWKGEESPFAIEEKDREFFSSFHFIEESEEQFCERVRRKTYSKIRIISPPTESLSKASGEAGCYLNQAPVLANGRIELLNYLREIALSVDYHRYGNLGEREEEKRAPIL